MQSVAGEHSQKRPGTADGQNAAPIDYVTRIAVLFSVPVIALALAIVVAALRLPLHNNPQVAKPKAADAGLGHRTDAAAAASADPKATHSEPSRSAPIGKAPPDAPPEVAPLAETADRAELQPENPIPAAPRTEPQRPNSGGGRLTNALERERDVIQLPSDREAYQLLSDLEAALESEAWEEAANIVTGPHAALARAVSPESHDNALAASVPVRLARVYEEFPQVRDALGERFGLLANLRLADARQAADPAAMEMVAVQFPGTTAAAQAHEWLGDLALGAGRFQEAFSRYERAIAIDTTTGKRVAPRLRLAAAMLGRESGEPITDAVALGDTAMESNDFEALIEEMRERKAAEDNAVLVTDYGNVAPAPVQWQPIRSSEKTLGQTSAPASAQRSGGNQGGPRHPLADELSAIVADESLLIAWQGGVQAIELSTGEQRWSMEEAIATGQRPRRAAFQRARPLVLGERLIVRQTAEAGMSWHCFDVASGKRLWQTEPGGQGAVVSDPILIEESIVALAASKIADQQGVLRLLTLDRATGRVIRERDVVWLGSEWFQDGRCEVAIQSDGILIDVGAALLRLDLDGNLSWMRLMPRRTEPQSEDRRLVAQQPLLSGERVFVVSHGGEAVECLDWIRGRRVWTRELPARVRLAGMAEGRLVAFGSDSVSALSPSDGSVLWRIACPQLVATPLLNSRHVLIAERDASPKQVGASPLRWTWIDSEAGKPLQSATVPGWTVLQPRLGPVLPHEGGLLCLAQSSSGRWELTRLAAAASALRKQHAGSQLAGKARGTFSGDERP